MYRGFDLVGELITDAVAYNVGLEYYNKQKNDVRRELNSFLLPNGSLDGSKLQATWFPEIEADIFISHSHKDEIQAITLAGWLYNHLGITSFIDSSIWGYSNDLLKIIDNEYCSNNSEHSSYDYDQRNYSTSHVHMMLNTALSKMIDKTECLFFLNSPRSITSKDVIGNKTNSPWIYSEIATSEIIRRRDLKEYRPEGKFFSKAHEGTRLRVLNEMRLDVEYRVYLGHLTTINLTDIITWKNTYTQQINKSGFPLNTLYSFHK